MKIFKTTKEPERECEGGKERKRFIIMTSGGGEGSRRHVTTSG